MSAARAASLASPAAALPLSPLSCRRLRTRGASRSRRPFRCAAGGSMQPWQYDDLSTSSSSSLEDLWKKQLRAMDEAQAQMADMHRQMDQQFAAAQAEAAQLERTGQSGASGRSGWVEQRGEGGGPCGYRWHRSYERNGSNFQEWRTESFTVIGVQPPGGCHALHAAPPAAWHLGGFGVVFAAAVAGFWAALTTAFNRNYSLTTFKHGSRWALLLLWPFLLLTSADFRQQFLAAVRGRRAGGAGRQEGGGSGDEFAAGIGVGKQA